MRDPFLKKAIFLSLAGHLAVLGIFGFSFGNKIPIADYGSINFLGDFLKKYDFLSEKRPDKDYFKKNIIISSQQQSFFKKSVNSQNQKKALAKEVIFGPFVKPKVSASFSGTKQSYFIRLPDWQIAPKKKRDVLTFYPVMPRHFSLYFKDRQVAHIELMFNIPKDKKNAVVTIKRKVASGNLEVDLLSKRYMSHYLYLQQSRFTPDKWNTVKIELAPKND